MNAMLIPARGSTVCATDLLTVDERANCESL
jgi:hypothetical protein